MDLLEQQRRETPSKSWHVFERALKIGPTSELPYSKDWSTVELGEALLALGRVDRPLTHLTAAKRPGPVAGRLHALIGAALGKAQVLANWTDAVEAKLTRVLSYARRVGHRHLEQMVLRRLAMGSRTGMPAPPSPLSKRPSGSPRLMV